MVVVVVLPWVPAIAILDLRRISSANISAPAHNRQTFQARFIQLRVTRFDRGRDHYNLGLSKVFRPLTFKNRRTQFLKTLGDLGGLQIRPLHHIAKVQQHLGNTRHANAADAHEMDRTNVTGKLCGWGHLYLCPLSGRSTVVRKVFHQRDQTVGRIRDPHGQGRVGHLGRALRVAQDHVDLLC